MAVGRDIGLDPDDRIAPQQLHGGRRALEIRAPQEARWQALGIHLESHRKGRRRRDGGLDHLVQM